MYGSSSALIYSNVGNKDLRWERQKILDVGFDLSLFDRVNLSFAYWQKNNSDIILSVPTPPSLGIPGNSISQNYGDVENNGIEFEIGGVVVDKGDFSWSSSLNFTTQNSRVDRLVSDIISNSVLLIREGEPLYSIYVHRYAGVNMANGNPMYYKKDGSIVQCNPIDGKYYVYDPANPDDMSEENNLLDEDKEIIGTTIPKWFGGFNNTFRYKNWDLNIFLRFSGGNYIFNHQRINMLSMGFYNNSAPRFSAAGKARRTPATDRLPSCTTTRPPRSAIPTAPDGWRREISSRFRTYPSVTPSPTASARKC